jgi:protein-disulfide isomerase
MVHFASFTCERCTESAHMIEKLIREYPGQIKWVHRNFLGIQDEIALSAAQFGEVAHEKGRFWEFHDAVFQSENRLDWAALQKIAEKLNLGWTSFQKGKFEQHFLLKVKKDIHDAKQLGVSSVPVIFVNGMYFSGTFPYGRLKSMVAEELNHAARFSKNQKPYSVSKP